MGDDAVKASEYGIFNLKRELPLLPKWTYESGDIYGQNLSSMMNQVIGQFSRYCMHVMTNIGGVYCDYKTVDQPGAVFTDEPRVKQEEAFKFLNRHVLTEPTWLTSQPYVNRLVPNAQAYVNRIGQRFVRNMVSASLINRLTSTYPAEDYLATLVDNLFTEARTQQKPFLSCSFAALPLRA